jgi:aspartyl-tRNA(Asn)/glutamyl-tRNA(Gln) amidotransferase subunit C
LSESHFMELNDALVENLCKLACLEFDAAGKLEIKKDLQKMIGFVEKLNELDLREVEPLLYMGEETNVLRDDFPEKPLSRLEALQNAPYADDMYFKVPQVVKNPAPPLGAK